MGSGPNSQSYLNEYDTFARGLKYQEFIAWLFGIVNYHTKAEQYNIGENPIGMEIKLDARCTDKNHFWIECYERTNIKYNWTPSGIWRDDNSILYAQGNWHLIARFNKKDLQETDPSMGDFDDFCIPDEAYAGKYERWCFPFKKPGDKYLWQRATGIGIVLPFDDAKEIAIDWKEISMDDMRKYVSEK